MRYFDAHLHADVRSFEDFHTMHLFGTKGVLICAHNSVNFSNAGSLCDHFDSLLTRQCQRFTANQITPFVALGIHPRGIPRQELAAALAALPEYLQKPSVVALGEIGLDLGTADEIEVLRQQLTLAKQLNKPCVLHTPPLPAKITVVTQILQLLTEVGIDPRLVLIDHLTREVFPSVKERGCYLGLSAHPAKLSPEEIAELIAEFGPERVLVSSDMGNSKADVGSLPKVASEMKHRGFPPKIIEQVLYRNALEFLHLSLVD